MKTLHFENRQKNTEHLLLALAKIANFVNNLPALLAITTNIHELLTLMTLNQDFNSAAL